MFHLADYALSEFELALLEDTATAEPDGLLWYAGTTSREKRGTYNAAEILLYWCVPERYGVQRIMAGVTVPMSAARWRTRLAKDQYGDSLIAVRQRQVSAAFPQETVTYLVVGWRLRNYKYWSQRGAMRADAPITTRIEAFSAAQYIHPRLEKKANEKN